MIEGISSTSYQYRPQALPDIKLTDDQKDLVNTIISKYDPETASEDDIKTMFEELKEAGITPGSDLKSLLDEAGFEPPKKPEGERPLEPPGAENKTDFVQQFLEKIESGEIAEDDVASLIQSLQSSGLLTTGSLVNKTA